MRKFGLSLGIVAASLTIGSAAQAQNYPWCANYGSGFGGASNCGFVSFNQCMQTLNGMGGYCARNTQYVGPTEPRSRRYKHYREY